VWEELEEEIREEMYERGERRTKRAVRNAMAERLASYALEGEEVQNAEGRAWVCSVTKASVMI
jgi:hypothetical protein